MLMLLLMLLLKMMASRESRDERVPVAAVSSPRSLQTARRTK
jgi:hypothetical protein